MVRLIVIAALGYGAYRIAKQFIRSVPDDFEPVALIAPPSKEPVSD
jgi:hypothetical protein